VLAGVQHRVVFDAAGDNVPPLLPQRARHTEDRRVGLSIKAANYDESRLEQEIAAYDHISANEELSNLGDILDEASKE